MSEKEIIYGGKGQAARLVSQHEKSKGVEGIFGDSAKAHDVSIFDVSKQLLETLKSQYTTLQFRIINELSKEEINKKLNSIDNRMGKTLFVKKSNIKPDGGIIQVKDKQDKWRIILVSEAKHQGNDIEKIMAGQKQGTNKDQDLMVAGNAIERVHKNILEIRNYMIDEDHFPYVVFLQGTNFATETIYIDSPDGRKIKIGHDMGSLNRIDRVTASNYSMEINTNHCQNINVLNKSLQSASLYFQCYPWDGEKMLEIISDIAKSSIEILQQKNAI